MVGNLDVAFDIFLARRHIGKHRRQQIVGAHALNLRRDLLAVPKAQQRQRARRVPAPARFEDRRRQRRLLQNRLHGFGMQEMKDIGQRKAVLLGQRDVQPVVGRRRLQFEVEAAAEALAQRQSPGLVDASAERRVNDQLHAAAFVEEALGDDRLLRRHRAQHSAALQDVFDRLLRAGIVEAALVLEPTHGGGHFRMVLRDADRGTCRPRRSLTCWRSSPRAPRVLRCARELRRARREHGRRAVRILHQHASRTDFHAPNPPGRVAQQHDVALLLSTAKSSSSVPTTVPSGSATTVYSALSGIAPPLVMAASRAPRRARSFPFTRSRCRYAP